ncbi:unnamed protein product [Boreogadus saida]
MLVPLVVPGWPSTIAANEAAKSAGLYNSALQSEPEGGTAAIRIPSGQPTPKAHDLRGPARTDAIPASESAESGGSAVVGLWGWLSFAARVSGASQVTKTGNSSRKPQTCRAPEEQVEKQAFNSLLLHLFGALPALELLYGETGPRGGRDSTRGGIGPAIPPRCFPYDT